MPISEHRRDYLYSYKKEHYRRIPFEVSTEQYNSIKNAADHLGESTNEFIRKSVDLRLESLEQDKQEKE